ncbi:uncharacterized protein K489DRAFT_407090 [Dissoconium aciculare CBS 342.82]|uniref:Uncharacterized protein n=1 Tax=Dissoconium aciculare CBS 342.82 TaxID=1314786 RepID=A0A6J3MEN1_9PEZI|nr:uncharacterized protein K489DRAFT_407090 [Dissoconium aciculare CBS 342.82]KAF1826338.1 hypothetical protein K489DRAFT_407090 [Dissoconium aciculare CBS 342.82]
MPSRGPRPESTIAQIFADDLDAMFGLTPEVEQLTQTVEDKKLKVSSGNRELQELEARLKKAEQRLARVSRNNSPATSPTSEQPPILENAQQAAAPSAASNKHPLAQQPSFPASRPATSQQQQAEAHRQQGFHNANGNNANEYVMVDRTAARA